MGKFQWLRLTGVSLLMVAMASPTWGFGRGGGGGGGGRIGGGGGRIGGGGGGGARPSFGGGGARPNFGGGGGMSRPNISGGGMSRPSAPIRAPQSRPSMPSHGGGIRPPTSIANRPSQPPRPSISKPSPITRPGSPSGSRPGGGLIGNPGARPSFPNQPGGIGGGNLGLGERPSIKPGERPGVGGRPNQPGLWNRPGGLGDNRPGGGNKLPGEINNKLPGNIAGNRPGGIGNRPGGSGNNIGNNIGNNVNINNIHNNYWGGGHNNYWNNGDGYGHYHGDWYHGSWHGNWNNNWYNRPAAWWGAGFISGAVVSSFTPWSWGYATYFNPYYVEPVVLGSTVVNYSQPIVLADTSAMPVANPPVDVAVTPDAPAVLTPEEEAGQFLSDARTAFYQGDYAAALTLVDKAIQKSPSDPVLHEFRALVLFATKQYAHAAATLYAVLSAGPGWDWTTLISLYPNVDTYTQQLRALEAYRRANPMSAEARFVLAYHYLTGGHADAAVTELKEVVKLQPSDQLSAQLIKTLSPPVETEPAPAPAPAEATAAATPIEAARLVGDWKATQPDGSIVALTITSDSKFSWKFTQNKKPQEISGTSTVADNMLILKPADGPPLVGTIALLADNKMSFRLDASNPNDPGLMFVR